MQCGILTHGMPCKVAASVCKVYQACKQRCRSPDQALWCLPLVALNTLPSGPFSVLSVRFTVGSNGTNSSCSYTFSLLRSRPEFWSTCLTCTQVGSTCTTAYTAQAVCRLQSVQSDTCTCVQVWYQHTPCALFTASSHQAACGGSTASKMLVVGPRTAGCKDAEHLFLSRAHCSSWIHAVDPTVPLQLLLCSHSNNSVCRCYLSTHAASSPACPVHPWVAPSTWPPVLLPVAHRLWWCWQCRWGSRSASSTKHLAVSKVAKLLHHNITTDNVLRIKCCALSVECSARQMLLVVALHASQIYSSATSGLLCITACACAHLYHHLVESERASLV